LLSSSVLIVFFGAAPHQISRILRFIQSDSSINRLGQIYIQLVCQANQVNKNVCKLFTHGFTFFVRQVEAFVLGQPLKMFGRINSI